METMLEGTRVLDLSRLLPGPYCSMILANLGAEVIKVESPLMGDPLRVLPPFAGDESCRFLAVNGNKKSLAVNIRREEGRAILLKLARGADVFLEGSRPGAMSKLRLGYEHLREVNPRIIYCSLSGYGQGGPLRDRAGHDLNYCALGGLLHAMRPHGGSISMPGVQIADISSALFAAIGILSALLARERSGVGTHIDASIFHSAVAFGGFSAAPLLSQDIPSEGEQEQLTGAMPCYNLYETKDGALMSLGALEPEFWAGFCEAVGREDLIPKQFPATGEREVVVADVRRIFSQRTLAEWAAFFADKDVCCESVCTLEDALAHPQVAQMGMGYEVTHPVVGRVKQIGLPLRSSLQSSLPPTPPPLLGQHTAELLREVGYAEEEIESLRTKKVVTTEEDAQRGRRLSV